MIDAASIQVEAISDVVALLIGAGTIGAMLLSATRRLIRNETAQLRPDGGQSLTDRVTRIEGHIGEIAAQVEAVEKRLRKYQRAVSRRDVKPPG